jgi:SAM-dependent methyltransferase
MVRQATRRNRKAIAEGRAELQLGSLDALPWPSQSVDKILGVNVAYFFSQDGGELREARRLLRPGGRMVIFATHRSTMSHWPFVDRATHTLLDEDRLRALATLGGFDSSEVAIDNLTLQFGIRGLIAILTKQCDLSGADRRRIRGHEVSFFGLFSIPSPIAPDRELAGSIWELHEVGATSLILLASFHAAAALWHPFLRRGPVLARMLSRQNT